MLCKGSGGGSVKIEKSCCDDEQKEQERCV